MQLTIDSAIPIATLLNQTTSQENGREYSRQWVDVYPYPCDRTERDRLDALNQIVSTALTTLHIATLPIRERRRSRALDVGCGTGIWATEFALSRPDVDVVGIDIGDIYGQPLAAPNLRFLTAVNFERHSWPMAERSFDFVRCGLLAGSVSDWPRLFRHIHR